MLPITGVYILFNILFNYISAVVTPPGASTDVVVDEQPITQYQQLHHQQLQQAMYGDRDSEGDRRHCKKCQLPKPQRSHHCSVCKKCVLKMDHHCKSTEFLWLARNPRVLLPIYPVAVHSCDSFLASFLASLVSLTSG